MLLFYFASILIFRIISPNGNLAQKTISTFYKKKNDKNIIEIGLAKENYFVHLSCDITQNFTVISDEYENYPHIDTGKNKEKYIMILNRIYPVTEITHTLLLDIGMDNFFPFPLTFYIEDIKFIKYTNFLGLGLNFERESFSVVHQLKKEGVINDLKFALVPHGKSDGTLYFGGVPNMIVSSMERKKCFVKNKKDGWSCEVSEVTINSERSIVYKYSHIAKFDTTAQYTSAPRNFFTILMEEVFAPYFDRKDCKIFNDFEPRLSCYCEKIANFPEIIFNIEGNIFALGFGELFEEINDACYFMMIENKEKHWIMGDAFLRKYIVEFDYAKEGSVSFYSRTPPRHHNKSTFANRTAAYFLISNAIVLSLGCINLIASKKSLV